MVRAVIGTRIKYTTGIILEGGIDIYGDGNRALIVNGVFQGTGAGNAAGTAHIVPGIYREIFGTTVITGPIAGGIGITAFHGNTVIHIIICPPTAITTISMGITPDQVLFGQILRPLAINSKYSFI
jgi:hypothetical protein